MIDNLARHRDVESGPVRSLPSAIGRIEVDRLRPGPSARRGGLRIDHIESLMTSAASWPPLLVERQSLAVVDGHHRLAAARRLCLATVAVEWFHGSRAAAAVEAVRRNVVHGLPLTLDERKTAAMAVLSSNPEWSDARVAEVCGLSPKTVGQLRRSPRMEAVPRPSGERRLGRDGKYRPVDSGPMRQRIKEALASQPQASLRQLASQLGVSHETVRTVRRQLSEATAVAAGDQAEPSDRSAPASWTSDSACRSTTDGRAFATWFDGHAVDPAEASALSRSVPLSRVYEVIDESVRRARFWEDFAASLRQRVR